MKRRGHSREQYKTGRGIINSLINKLPIELHLPGYQYCGPGTKLEKRLKRGDPGINVLDAACKQHDISYSLNKSNLEARHQADYVLEQKAWQRVNSEDASTGEKAAAWLVTNIMKGKRRFGMGMKMKKMKVKKGKNRKSNNRKVAFGRAIRRAVHSSICKDGGNNKNIKNIRKLAKAALLVARKSMKASGGKRNITTPRIIPIPKVGGILPLIPIFAGLSALGSLAGGAAGIVRAIKNVKNARENKNFSDTTLNVKGNGLHLKPYRKGLGLFLRPSKNSI